MQLTPTAQSLHAILLLIALLMMMEHPKSYSGCFAHISVTVHALLDHAAYSPEHRQIYCKMCSYLRCGQGIYIYHYIVQEGILEETTTISSTVPDSVQMGSGKLHAIIIG